MTPQRVTPSDPQPRRDILLVEDDQRLAIMVQDYLTRHGFHVTVESSGKGVDRVLAEHHPDLILLDLGLPDEDGLSILKRIRPRYKGTVVVLTAREDEVDEVLGLELGADDYVCKPVRPRALVARLNTLLTRSQPDVSGKVITLGLLKVDASRRQATLNGQIVEFTSAEFDLLWYLAERSGEVVSREELYQALRGIPYDGLDRSMDLRVSTLRRKLGPHQEGRGIIKSVRGVGYLLAPP